MISRNSIESAGDYGLALGFAAPFQMLTQLGLNKLYITDNQVEDQYSVYRRLSYLALGINVLACLVLVVVLGYNLSFITLVMLSR